MFKVFNDSIHGRVKISGHCVKIIDTIEFQRLRNLKQLGPACYVFYGATHTRFEHSIGVCWLAGKWAKHLQKQYPELDITDDEIKIVEIAGLIHDIGHGPLSHTFERFIKKTRNDITYHHEDMTIKIFKSMNLELDKVIIDGVCKIIKGEPLKKNAFLGHIVNNPINGLDCDKLDYFIRDSYCTSFAIGCDWKRIIYESRVKDGQIVYPYKMVGDIFNIYQTRFRLYKELYYHKKVSVIEDVLVNALIIADQRKVFNFNKLNLAHSIDNVYSFLLTNDDIIGQMERCEIPEVVNLINNIKTRTFLPKISNEIRIAHYGMHEKNPLFFVKFITKNNQYKEIDPKIYNSMCPLNFAMQM